MVRDTHGTGSREAWGALKYPIKHMRRNPTPAEGTLWRALRDRRVAGLKFRRQHPIGACIVDFYCSEPRLAVEVDGGIHDRQKKEDRVREDFLRIRGVTVIRFPNDEVMRNLQSVLDRIAAQAEVLRSPSPHGGEGDRG